MRHNPKILLRRFASVILVSSMISLAIPAIAFGTSFQVVTFGENDNPSDNVIATQTSSVPTSFTLFSALSPSFTDPGYAFDDWNTASDGSGASYANGATYSFASNMTLYAQWVANSVTVSPSEYTVAYNDNGGTGVLNPVTVTAGGSVQLPVAAALTYPQRREALSLEQVASPLFLQLHCSSTRNGWQTPPSRLHFRRMPGSVVCRRLAPLSDRQFHCQPLARC